MKLRSFRSTYNNYENIVVTASLESWSDKSTFIVSSCVANGSVAKYYLGGSNSNIFNISGNCDFLWKLILSQNLFR